MDPKLRVECVDYCEASGPVARRAAAYDVVVVVAPAYQALERVERYEALGVEVHVYDLPPTATPTLFSALGMVGRLRSWCREGLRVLVEGVGGEAVVAAMHLTVLHSSAFEALRRCKRSGLELLSPLQLRLLAVLEYMARRGLDVLAEARRMAQHAFTGGDAHLSSVLELALEHCMVLERLLPLRAPAVYWGVLEPLRAPRLNDAERAVIEASKALDHTMSGAVKSVHVEVEEKLRVKVGCELVYREEQCWPEAMAASEWYERIARMLRLEGVDLEMVLPEEAACESYGVLDPSMCMP